jgi:tetratricopeptide (TPR) repeat protein
MNAVPRLEIHLSGPFRIADGEGGDITPRGKRAKALIALLATAKNGVRSRKWIQEKLWSDRGPDQGAASLRQELTELRRHFKSAGVELISADREVIQLDLSSAIIDIHDTEGDAPTQDLLEGLDLCDPEFEDWLRDERRHWEAAAERRARTPVPAVVLPQPKPAEAIRAVLARPCVALLADFAPSLDPGSCALGNLFLDLVARSFLAFDAVDLIDLRVDRAPPAVLSATAGPDWILQVSAAAVAGLTTLSVQLRRVEDRLVLWSQTRRFARDAPLGPEDADLGSFVNDAVFATLDQIVKPEWPRDEARHEAARLAIGAIYQIFRLTDANLDAAERMLLRAYELERKSSYLGWLLFLSTTRLGERRVGRSGSFHEQARDYARRAVESDPFNPITLALTAHAYSFIFHEYEYALDLADRAVAANPMLAIARDLRALTLGYLGEVERGYADALVARALGGPPPYRYCIDTTCCILATLRGQFDEGISHGRRVLAQQPNYLPALRYTASCQGHSGMTEAAFATLAKIHELEPDFSLELLRDRDYPIAGVLGISVIEKGLSRIGLTAHPN